MKLRKSAATILFPAARKSREEMLKTLRYLRGKVQMAEFYYDGGDDGAVAAALEENGLSSIFVAVIPQKEQGLNLCSTDEKKRVEAVAFTKLCAERAAFFGSDAMMICSGKRPQNDSDVLACVNAFIRSVREVWAHIETLNTPLRLLLEPCDSRMDVRHLLGPTALVIDAVRQIRSFCPSFSLTMDLAHITEEGEDFIAAIRAAQPYCSHIHFANCVVDEPDSPFYGDKHVGFDYPGAAFSYASLHMFWGEIEKIYGDGHLDVAIEVLCRERDPFGYFDALMLNMPWFFKR